MTIKQYAITPELFDALLEEYHQMSDEQLKHTFTCFSGTSFLARKTDSTEKRGQFSVFFSVIAEQYCAYYSLDYSSVYITRHIVKDLEDKGESAASIEEIDQLNVEYRRAYFKWLEENKELLLAVYNEAITV
ncbi:hypothetical protein [Vibrio phage RYC]|nr:hypothetical protein [Vibrio phage RYC]